MRLRIALAARWYPADGIGETGIDDVTSKHSQEAELLPCRLEGYTDLPPGKLANLLVYLEMRAPVMRNAPIPGGFAIEPLPRDPAVYLELFLRVGKDWLWSGRLRLDDSAFAALLADPDIEIFALEADGERVGIMELDFREKGECELAYFGLVPGAIGRGAGRFLMNEAVSRAFSRPIERLFVHTCNFDHPGAVGFYKRSGFTPYKLAVEIHDDPRLLGLLPRDCAPHVPLLDPGSR
jgi:ribosomal protein S18 acetylase RimI-like enzyme